MSIECLDSSCHLHDHSTPYCTQNTCVKLCPVCSRIDYVPINIYNDAYNLGSGTTEFNCLHCNSRLEINIRRRIIAQILSIKCV